MLSRRIIPSTTRDKAVIVAQAADKADQPEKKKPMRSKELARKPKKLKQQTLNLYLEDESDEEEPAGVNDAGSWQAASAKKASTGKGSQTASASGHPGSVPSTELAYEPARSPSPQSRA